MAGVNLIFAPKIFYHVYSENWCSANDLHSQC